MTFRSVLFFIFFRSCMLNWFPSSDVIVFIVSAFSFHWASSYSWEYQSVRKRELESTRVSKQGYFFFCCGRTFFPVWFLIFFLLSANFDAKDTRSCVSIWLCVCVCCVCEREIGRKFIAILSLCAQWSWVWFTDEVSSVGPSQSRCQYQRPLPSSWLWEWSMLGDSRTVYVGGSAQGPDLWDLMHVIQFSVTRELLGRAMSVHVNVCRVGCGGLRSVYKGGRSSLTDATVQTLITGSHSYCYLLITGPLLASLG